MTHGYEIPRERDPRRPVATRDRFEAVRAVSDLVPLQARVGGDHRKVRSYLSELLDIAVGTGRRIGAVRALRCEDLRLSDGTPHGSIRWPADTDKTGRESTVPIGPQVRVAIARVLAERPGIGRAPLSSPADPSEPVGRHLVDRWLHAAERLAGLEHLPRGLWHPYRRKWATERKHLPDVDVAAAGGWKETATLKRAYQQADPATMLKVVLEAGELRETL